MTALPSQPDYIEANGRKGADLVGRYWGSEHGRAGSDMFRDLRAVSQIYDRCAQSEHDNAP